MKKLFSVIILTLALNFLAVAGGVGYLRATGKLDRAKVMAVKDVLFPPPSTQPIEIATTQPSDEPQRPLVRLEELLAQQTGRPASEQVEFIRDTFDAHTVQLERRQRELNDLQTQIDLAKAQLGRDRGVVAQQKVALETREQEQSRLATDKGFQDSLALYKTMPGKQVKSVFMSMDDQTAAQYLQAMEPRSATRIIKEFKSPEEAQFIQKVLQTLRQPQPSAATDAPTTQPVREQSAKSE